MDVEEFAQDLLQDVHAESDADGQFLEDVFFQKACDQLTEAGELETADRVFYRSPRGIRVDGYGGDPTESSGTLSLIILDFHVSETVGRITGSEMDTLFRRTICGTRWTRDGAMPWRRRTRRSGWLT